MNPAGALALSGLLLLILTVLPWAMADSKWTSRAQDRVLRWVAVAMTVVAFGALIGSGWWQVVSFEGRPYP